MNNTTPPLTSSFNLSSMFHYGMWIAMIGIGLTMLTGVPNATILDAVLSPFMHMAQGFVHLFSADGFQTLGTVWNNMMAGNIMPNYAGAMWNDALMGGVSHSGAAVAGSHVHTAMSATVHSNVWEWFAALPAGARETLIADAGSTPLGDYITKWCASTGVTFTP